MSLCINRRNGLSLDLQTHSHYRLLIDRLCFGRSLVLVTVFAFCASNCLAPEHAVGFQDGVNGINGDPGTDGQDAIDQVTKTVSIDANSPTQIVGNNGGVGGHGGNGVDGDDADATATGGNGGDGGKGSSLEIFNLIDAISQVPFQLNLIAGKGGRAGGGGSSVGVPDSQGGNAGDGGNVDIALSTNRSLSLSAKAGDGGDANGYQRNSGNGGTITSSVSTLEGPYQSIEASIYQTQNLIAGNGGTGRYLANGGRGGDVITAGTFELSPNSGRTLMNINALAGHGGRSYGGVAGNGGSVDWTMPGVSLPASATNSSQFHINATAGDGGNSFKYYEVAGRAGDGGNVSIQSVPDQMISVPGGKIDYSLQLVAGDGGYSDSHADGGNGGTVEVDDFLLSTSGGNTSNQSISSTVTMRAGDGGNSVLGRGGNGGNIMSLNDIRFQTAGDFDFDWTGVGGNGGNGLTSGDGGNSHFAFSDNFSEIPDNITNPESPDSNNLHPLGDINVKATAMGGHAGNGGASGVGSLDLQVTGYRNVSVRGYALQGIGANSVAANETISNITAINTGGGVDSVTSAYGYSAPRYDVTKAPPAVGRSVILSVHSASLGGRLTKAHGVAIGAFGTEKSGYAKAFVGAGTEGSQFAHAIAEAVAPAASSSATDNSRFAFSEASAYAPNGSGKSEAKTTVYGHNSFGRSAAYTSALQGEAIATARSQSTARPHQATVTTTTRSLAKSTEYQRINANSDIFFRRTELPANEFIPQSSNRTDLYISSGIGSLVGIQDTGLSGIFDFSDTTNDVFAAVHFDTDTRPVAETLQETSFEIDLTQEINSWEVDHDLSVFFYDVELSYPSTDGDFPLDMLLEVGGQTVIDQSFATGFDAISFLDEAVFNLGAITAGEDLVTHFEVSLQHENRQAFEFKMGIAGLAEMVSMGPASLQAVPEPSSIGLFTALTASLALVRRRRRA